MKIEGYGIFKTFKSGKLLKQLPIGVAYNYEAAIPDKDLPMTAITGISGSELFYNKKLAQREAAELNRLWEEDVFVVKKITIEVEEK